MAISLVFNSIILAQSYQKSLAINPTDSFQITASAIFPNGELVVASQQQYKTAPGGSGIPGISSSVGRIVLRRLDKNGNPLWKKFFHNSVARIMFAKTTSSDDILVCGAFHDSLRFSPTKTLYAAIYRANSFVACYDGLGNFKWVYSTPADPNYSKFYNTFDIRQNKIYLPYNTQFSSDSRIRVLNMLGDSINDFQISDGAILISHFKFDAAGNVYLCGTGNGSATIGGQPVGNDSTIISYSAFIAKLDSNFQQSWSDQFRYITIDFYPEMAFTSSRVAFLVDTIPQPNGIGNYHILKYYDLNGNALRRDSIGPGFFSKMHQAKALTAIGNDFYLATLNGWDTVVVQQIDAQFNYKELARIDMSLADQKPWFIANDSVFYYNHSFYDSTAVINKTDTVFNPRTLYTLSYNYQQILVKFSTNSSSISVAEAELAKLNWQLFPNPSSSGNLTVTFNDAVNAAATLSVFTVDGKLLLKHELAKGQKASVLNFEKVPAGIFIIQIANIDGVWSKRWIRL